MLAEYAPRRQITLDAPDVASLIDRLEDKFPKLRWKLRDEAGSVRRFVKVFVNGEEIRALEGIRTPLAQGDVVDILHSIQGG